MYEHYSRVLSSVEAATPETTNTTTPSTVEPTTTTSIPPVDVTTTNMTIPGSACSINYGSTVHLVAILMLAYAVTKSA